MKLKHNRNTNDSLYIHKSHIYCPDRRFTCLSDYRWRATGTDKATSTQVMLMQCIVGRTDMFISVFLNLSRSTLSHSHNSTFCLATAIPQMWSGLQQTSLRNIKSPWQPLLITFASSACNMYLCQIWWPFFFLCLSLDPLFITSFFSSICTTLCTLTLLSCSHTVNC